MSRIKVTKSQSKSLFPYVGTLERNKKFKGTTPGRVQHKKAVSEVHESKEYGQARNEQPSMHGKNEGVLGTFDKAKEGRSPMEEHPRFEKHPGMLSYGEKNAGPNK